MRYPPIKADRALLWITLHPDTGVKERYAALRALLKTCRLHPLDTTASAELVIVEEAAFRARMDEVRRLLSAQDTLHLITQRDGRLVIETVEVADTPTVPQRPAAQRPPWLKNAKPAN